LSEAKTTVCREVVVPNRAGFHARPVMRFVDTAKKYQAEVTVTNLSRREEPLDGKNPMELMLLEATQGSRLRIQTQGCDADEAADELAKLVAASFYMNT
jgi:phosphotransferase system HPr (HPr) family protein